MRILSIILLVLVSACSTPKDQVETYKIQFGKKCAADSGIYSYVWFHTVYGEQQVKKEYCK